MTRIIFAFQLANNSCSQTDFMTKEVKWREPESIMYLADQKNSSVTSGASFISAQITSWGTDALLLIMQEVIKASPNMYGKVLLKYLVPRLLLGINK